MVEKDIDLEFFPQKHGSEGEKPSTPCEYEKTKEISFGSCEDFKDCTINNVEMRHEGRLLRVRVDLDRVCRGRKVNLGVIIYENHKGSSHIRGFRACQISIPGPIGQCIDNLRVGEFMFVFPDENVCRTRKFEVKVIAHYAEHPSFPCRQ